MFKFLKSKKGFTLVELMIVVVIMAILVAVAVPIYTAVTKKAKIKTCSANQREIQAQLNNNQMAGVITLADGDEFTLTTNPTADDGTWSSTAPTGLDKLFQKCPFCPVEGAVITVKVADAGIAGAESSGFKITTACNQVDHEGYVAA